MQTRRTNGPGGPTILHTPVRPIARWLSTWLIVALVAACGGGGGGGGSEPGNTGTPPAAAFTILPSRLALTIGDEGMLFPLQTPGALTWSSSDPAVASVNAQGQVTALAAGSAVISATAGAAVSSATVRVYPTTAPTPTALIATALAQNRITAEQALTYRVFALFGDQRLPAEFEGAPDVAPDHMLMRQVSASLATLSQVTQDILVPFLLPPIYAESWHSQQMGLPRAAAAASGKAHAAAAQVKRAQVTTTVNCDADMNRALWRMRATAHFNIYYFAFLEDGDDTYNSRAAAVIASVVEEVYTDETRLFERYPVSDETENCNGGDGAVDIYLTNTLADPHMAALTQSYPDRCNNVPSFVAINSNHAVISAAAAGQPEGRDKVKAVVAHEFAHVLQLAMDRRGGSCENYEWLDEATAEWVMDFVGPSVNIEDGLNKAAGRQRSGFFYAQYLFSDHMASIEASGRGGNPKRNGYADYIFFQYLAKKYDPQVIKQIWDATVANPSVWAVDTALAAKGGMKAVWPEFALTLWNDSSNNVLDDFSHWDNYDFGLAAIYQRQVTIGPEYAEEAEKLKTIEVDQKGESRATFKLLDNALPGPDEFGSDFYQILPRSVFYEHLKFSDPTVHSVLFFNPIAAIPNLQFMKVQAKKKIGGQWKEVEDWTGYSFKQFCLDKIDERLEELLVVVSNSQVIRDVEDPFYIPKQFPMRISTSNVGCWRWQGTASTRITIADPVNNTVATASAIVQFEAVPTQIPGRITFETSAGVVNGVLSGTIGTPMGTCSIDLFAADTPIVKKAPPDGTIDINLDLDIGSGLPPDRNLITLAGNSVLSTRQRLICPSGTETTTVDMSWTWLQVDDLNSREVSADGQKIEGEFNQSNPAINTTIRTLFNFSALRE